MRNLAITRTVLGLVLSAVLLAPKTAQAEHSRDWELCESHDEDVAIAACTRIIESGRETQENLARAHYQRAAAYDSKDDLDRAIDDYTQVLLLQPTYSDAYFFRARVYFRKREYDRAILDFSQHLLLKPDDPTTYTYRALAYHKAGHYDKAIDDYTKSVLLSPKWQLPYQGRGDTYLDNGEYDKAIGDYDEAIQLVGGNWPYVLGKRGWAYFKKQNFDQAIADAKHAAELAPATPSILENLAKIEEGRRAWLARTQSQPTGRRVALIIGNGVYRTTTPLPNAIHDAEDVARELKKLGYEIFGFPATNFSKRALAEALDQFSQISVGATSAVIWYSGHGQQSSYGDDERASLYDWIIPVDAVIKRRADVANNALRVDTLINAVLAAKQVRLVVIDACRNNTFWNETRGVSRKSVERASVLVVYSAQPGNVAIDDIGGRNSPFAQAFIETLRADPRRDVQKLFDAVTGRTAQLTQGEQRPQPIGGLGTGEVTPLVP